MTKQEISVFEAYEENIVSAATKLRKAYTESHWLNAADAPDFYQRILLEAPAALLNFYRDSWNDEDAMRAFLFSYFFNKLRDARKKAKRRELLEEVYTESAQQSALYEMEVGEAPEALAKMVVRKLLSKAAPDVQALCSAYMIHKSWAEAGLQLGWSKGKLYRVQSQTKNFFQENAILCGEFFDLAPMNKCRQQKR